MGVNGYVKAAASRIAPLSHGSLYGDTFQVRVDETPVNIAYTTEALKPHMDLAYYESPPGLQFLHCIQFDKGVQGGESIFYDTFLLAELLREHSPRHFATLCQVPATFMKDHTKRSNPAQMYFRRPHISVNHLGIVTSVFWSPAFEGPLILDGELSACCRTAADLKGPQSSVTVPEYSSRMAQVEDIESLMYESKGLRVIEEYYEAYHAFANLMTDVEVATRFQIKFRLPEGCIVSFNQRRLLHGREAFISHEGTRWLEGCYVGIDDFLNRHRTLALVYGSGVSGIEYAPRIGNSSW